MISSSTLFVKAALFSLASRSALLSLASSTERSCTELYK